MLECLGDELTRLCLGPIEALRVGIIGVGSIGSEMSRQLSIRGITALHHDLLSDSSTAADLVNILSVSDIILSSTGGGHIGMKEYELINGDKILVNCGSSDVEFNLWQIASNCRHQSASPALFAHESPPWSSTAVLTLHRSSFTFLRGGFPINFDGSLDPIPEDQIQLTRAALMAGALQSVQQSAPGVYCLDYELQKFLLESFSSITQYQLQGG